MAITPGEPGGIGPELVCAICQRRSTRPFVAIADPGLLEERARLIGLDLTIRAVGPEEDLTNLVPAEGELPVVPVTLRRPAQPGVLDPANAPYVLDTLRVAARGCLSGRFSAMVTAPVHKGVINDAGIPFSGHTEFLAELASVPLPVMMLAAPGLRVALVTTHLPLREVSNAITGQLLCDVVRILDHDLRVRFAIAHPRILVCGLNPHAGESGHLGREEIEIIEPALARLRGTGIDLTGPLPADTAFTPDKLAAHDAVLAMYHDQGLPVLKALGFGNAVNVTLGLPFVRTSVDHGTALDLAGTGRADPSSLVAATLMAAELAPRHLSGGQRETAS